MDSALYNDLDIEACVLEELEIPFGICDLDALKTGIENYAEVISTERIMAGAVLESCSPEFGKLFKAADLIISRGVHGCFILPTI